MKPKQLQQSAIPAGLLAMLSNNTQQFIQPQALNMPKLPAMNLESVASLTQARAQGEQADRAQADYDKRGEYAEQIFGDNPKLAQSKALYNSGNIKASTDALQAYKNNLNNVTATDKNFQNSQTTAETLANTRATAAQALANSKAQAARVLANNQAQAAQTLANNKAQAETLATDSSYQKQFIKKQADSDHERVNNYDKTQAGIDAGVEGMSKTISLIDELKKDTNGYSTGWGSLLSVIPETDAGDWAAKRDTIVSRLTLETVSELKALSATGSTGFGALSEKEMKVLQDKLGSLDSSQSEPEIIKVLDSIQSDLKTSITRMNAAKQNEQNWMRERNGQAPLSNEPLSTVQQSNSLIKDSEHAEFAEYVRNRKAKEK